VIAPSASHLSQLNTKAQHTLLMKQNHSFHHPFAAAMYAVFFFAGCSTPEPYPSSTARSTASLNARLPELNAAMSGDSVIRPSVSSNALTQEAMAAARANYPQGGRESLRRAFASGYIDAKAGHTPNPPNASWGWNRAPGGWIRIHRGGGGGSGVLFSEDDDGDAYIAGWNASAPTSSSYPQNLPSQPPPFQSF